MTTTRSSMRDWAGSGSPWVWLTAGAVSICLVMVVGLIVLIGVRGLTQYWPASVEEFRYTPAGGDPRTVLGEMTDSEGVARQVLVDTGWTIPEDNLWPERLLYKVGNRDLTGSDFSWYVQEGITDRRIPEDALVLEREEWGNAYGYLEAVLEDGERVGGPEAYGQLEKRLERREELAAEINHVEEDVIGGINYRIERLRLKEKGLELRDNKTSEAMAELAAEERALEAEYAEVNKTLKALYEQMRRDALVLRVTSGETVEIPLAKVVRAYRPNAMGPGAKVLHYFDKLGEFIFDEPREANTEGGVFPAIFGTVMMVIIMSIFVTPFGVVAAVYLREYAKQGPITRAIRIAVNNLAGVPSVVYGVFGLGFFVYFIGGNIDQWFFPEALPAPTFGTPGLLWSSLTLAILTVPVVIVATEEGLSRIPRSIREGSLALGATKAETMLRTILPMATPAMMTGLILAVARAAGEVAPLMMVGVVKLAPSLPLDGNPPFLHLDRKFMHLGFHIYDVGFQSPNVEAARPLVYATAFLLVVIIISLNIAAIRIRNHLREKFSATES